MARTIKYHGQLYIEVDSTKDELYNLIKRLKEEYGSLAKMVAGLGANASSWLATGDFSQIESDIRVFNDMKARLTKLEGTLKKAREHLKRKG